MTRALIKAPYLCMLIAPLAFGAAAFAQPPAEARPPLSAREAAPVELTGYWVSVVSEDWRWRMVTPIRGDFASIPLNPEGQRVGMAWDPEADEAAGLECKSYGGAAIMRVPGRLHITWQDDETLRIETDAGMQTRLLHFGAPPPADEAPSWQGYSVANWERPATGIGERDPIGLFVTRIADEGRTLEVQTSHLRTGYLRRNGPPYSDQTTVREYFNYFRLPNGDEWFTVTTVVEDPLYLRTPYITSSDFRKQPNADGWNPTPCTAR